MNSPYFIGGMLSLFGGVIASRIVVERAFRLLTKEEKLTLLESFSQLRMFGSIPLMLILGLMVGTFFLPHARIAPAFFAICVLFIVVMAVQQRYINRRLRALAIAENYRRAIVQAQWLSRLGFLAFFTGMAATIYW